MASPRRSRSVNSYLLETRLAAAAAVLAQRLVAITQLAEELDRGTLELALRLVPVEWWAGRLGTTAPPE